MAIEINGKTYRNLTEQVGKNQEDISTLFKRTISEEEKEAIQNNLTSLNQEMSKTLKIPDTPLTSNVLLGIDSSNAQTTIRPGRGLSISNNFFNGMALNATALYEYERDIEHDQQDFEPITSLGLDRKYNGTNLDIISVVLSGYVEANGRAQLVSHDIIRQIQSVPAGETRAFKLSGTFANIADDNVYHYAFKVDIKASADGSQFYIKTSRCITGPSFQGQQLTSASTFTFPKVRSILALPITVI